MIRSKQGGFKYGQSTTHWNKLLPRVNLGGGGECPLLLVGIEPERVAASISSPRCGTSWSPPTPSPGLAAAHGSHAGAEAAIRARRQAALDRLPLGDD